MMHWHYKLYAGRGETTFEIKEQEAFFFFFLL